MKPIPLFGTSLASFQGTQLSAQSRLNCYYEIRPDQDKNQIVIKGTPGTTVATGSGAGLPGGFICAWLYELNGSYSAYLYVVTDTGFYHCSGSDLTIWTKATGPFAGGSTATYTTQMSSNGTQVFVWDGSFGWIYTIATNTIAQITDANFPPTAGRMFVAFLDGRFTVNSPFTNQFYSSGSFDGTQWGANAAVSPLIFNTKSARPDRLQAVYAFHDTLVIFGSQSIEYWQDTGSYPNPYSRIPGTTQDFGLAAIDSVAVVNNSLMFVATNPQGQCTVMKLQGYVPQSVASNDVLNYINNASTPAGALQAVSYVVDGHSFYQLNAPFSFGGNTPNGFSMLYDDTTGMWSFIGGDSLISGSYTYHNMRLALAWEQNKILAARNDSSGGAHVPIYFLSNAGSSDILNYLISNTPPYSMRRQVVSRHIYGEGNYIYISELQLDMVVGSTYGPNVNIILEISRDGGNTFESPRNAQLSSSGQYLSSSFLNRVIWRRIGAAFDFVFRFTLTHDSGQFIINKAVARVKNPEQVREK